MPCKILIIDDDTDDVEILAEVFMQSGVDSVHYVHSAMQAFAYLEQVEQHNDLVINLLFKFFRRTRTMCCRFRWLS